MSATDHARLFVYGTLLTVAEHPLGDRLRRNARLLGRGSIRARLYVIDDPDDPGNNFYPGALPSPDPADRVHGEVYDLLEPAALIEAFDAYEACSPDWPEPHEFIRRSVEVALEAGGATRAWSYLYSWDVSTARHVKSGRFTEVSTHVR